MDVAFVPALSLTLVGFTETVGLVLFAGKIVAERVIVPENPPTLERVRLEKPDSPGRRLKLFGIGVRVKSRGRGLDRA